MTTYLIWPERKIVSDEWIETQFADAISNSYIPPERISAKDVMEMARALDDAGLITLGTEPERPALTAELVDATIHEDSLHEFVCEHSDLGLRVGDWPEQIPTTHGNKKPFLRSTKKINADGDLEYVRYRQALGCISLIVFND